MLSVASAAEAFLAEILRDRGTPAATRLRVTIHHGAEFATVVILHGMGPRGERAELLRL